MVITVDATQELADRIERAYLRGRPLWPRGCPNPRLWSAVAEILMQLHWDDPGIPVDPELYVAAQPEASPLDDPWLVLAQPESARRYRACIRRAVRRLRDELRREVRWAEARLRREGAVAEDVVLWAGPDRLSPLARIIVAIRAGRPELVAIWRPAAWDQHRACPLYRQACRGLLPDALYPVAEVAPGVDLPPRARSEVLNFSAN